MRYVCRGTAVALSILAVSASLGQGSAQSFSLANFQMVSQVPVRANLSSVSFTAQLLSVGSSYSSVTATATTNNPFAARLVPGQDTLTFTPVPANTPVTSTNTFSVLMDPTVPFNPANLSFTFQAVAGPLHASAGPSQTVKVGALVTLDGSGSTSPGGPLTYSWAFASRPAGSAAVLSNPAAIMPTFTVDVTGNYVITLTVSSGGASSSANVTISTLSSPPMANAGPNQTVLPGTKVTLDGSGSTDTDGNPLTYSWFLSSIPGGSTAVLTGSTTVNPTFVADLAGTYMAKLLVNDGVTNSINLSTVTITTTSTAPVANAGPNQLVNLGQLVQLNGSASTDVDGNPLSYSWALTFAPTGSTAKLSNSHAVNPTFTADVAGTYLAQLVVNDGSLASAPSTVMISTRGTQAPTANAGLNQSVVKGATVTLHGTGSDPNNLPLTFSWTFNSIPTGSTAKLTNATSQTPTFVADLVGTYVAQLIVSNGVQLSPPSTVTISTGSTPPVANAGLNQNVPVLATVHLDGSGSSDSAHNPLTYSWSFLSRPAGSAATLVTPTSVMPMFVADLAGTYVVQLIVNNGSANSSPATVMITASSAAITLTPNPLTLNANSGTLTVMLSAPAGTNGQVVNLLSSNTSAATVPASVTIPSGAVGANVTVSAGGTVGTSVLTASAPGFASGNTMVVSNVAQINLPIGVSLAPGQTADFQVTLFQPAPSGGVFISLFSSNTSIVSVNPTFLFIQPGALSPVRAPQVTGVAAGTATITASATGMPSTTQSVTVTGMGAFGFSPTSLVITGPTKGFLTLTIPVAAPSGGLTVNLSSDNTSVATVASSIFIAAGGSTVTVPVTGVAAGSTVVHANALPTLPDTTASVTVVNQASVVLPAFMIIGQWGFSGPMPVSLSTPAPAGGVTVTLTSDAPPMVAVSPATIFIPAGATTPASMPILTGEDIGYGTITASAPGYVSGSVQVHDTDDITIGLEDGLTVMVGQSVPYLVCLPGAAPVGGVTISLVSLDTTKLTVPASVFIPAGQMLATVPVQVTGISPGIVTIRGSSPNYSTEVQTVTVIAKQ